MSPLSLTDLLNLKFPRVLELIQETKWLIRLECAVPEAALEVLKEENRIKSYVQVLYNSFRD